MPPGWTSSWCTAGTSPERCDLPYEIDDASVAGARIFVDMVTGPGVQPPPGLFGPMVPVAADASPLDQLVARTGRDPAWSPLGLRRAAARGQSRLSRTICSVGRWAPLM